jgi:O-antigen ligase
LRVLLAQRDFWKPALVILCILTALAAGPPASSSRCRSDLIRRSKNDKVGDERPFYWAAAWQLFQRDIPWGIGPGHFDVEFPSVRPWRVQEPSAPYAHNDYLNTLCEWGVTGMGLIAAACGLLYWGVFQVWRKPAQALQ